MSTETKPVIGLQRVYGVRVYRERGDGQQIDAFMVRSDSPDGAIAKALLHRRHVSRVECEFLGFDQTGEYFDRQFKWLVDSKAEYEAARVNGLIGYYLTERPTETGEG